MTTPALLEGGLSPGTMSNSNSERPKAVTVIGWVCIVIGAVMLFNATIVLVANLMIKTFGAGDTGSSPFSNSVGFPAPVSFVFAHFAVFAGLQVLLAFVLIYLAAMLLRLKSWARSALVGMCWAFLAAIAVFWVSLLVSILGSMGAASSGQTHTSGAYASAGIIVTVSSFLALLLAFGDVVLLKSLRRKDVREACRQ